MKTAAELKAEQVAREAANQEALRAKEDAEQRRRDEAAQAKLVRQVEDLKKSWFTSVEEASKHDGIRFAVLAEVVDQHGKPEVRELVKTIEEAGYKCAYVTLPQEQQGLAFRTKKEAREVAHEGVRGWHPADVPQLGSSGSMRTLIVKWG